MIKLYTDAATKGNPGLSGAGILIVSSEIQFELFQPLPVMSNHEAEFAAAILGLQTMIDHGWVHEQVSLISDSQLLVDALDKRYAKHYNPQVQTIVALADAFPLVIPVWQNDHQNKRAHVLAQRALHQAEDHN